MQDIIGKFFIIIIGAIFLFFVPVTVIALKQDNTAQTYVDNAAVEFIDNARASAMITPEAYEKLIQKVDAAQPGCNIQLIHSAKYITPDYNNDALKLDGTDKYEYTAHQEDYFKEDILEYMFYKDGADTRNTYYLKDGDYLKIIIDNKDAPTLGARLVGSISSRYDQMTIYTSYGGFVGNYAQ